MKRLPARNVFFIFIAAFIIVGIYWYYTHYQFLWKANQILEKSEIKGGLVVHLGFNSGKLTAALHVNDRYLIHGLSPEEKKVEKARRYISDQGSYGKVSVKHWDQPDLPYGDDLVNLLVVSQAGSVSRDEMMRVLAPRGVVLIKDGGEWEKVVKPRPEGTGEWTHFRYGPRGNPVTKDTVIGPPRHLQWVSEPRWQTHHNMDQSIAALVSAGGRMFYIVNDVPPGIEGLPGQWYVMARDAYSGIMLWKRKIPEWGWEQWSNKQVGGRFNKPIHLPRRLVATDDKVYVTLGFNAPVTALDVATGEKVRTYEKTQYTSEIVEKNGVLYLSVNQGPQRHGQVEEKPAVKKHILAVNAETGEILWESDDYSGISTSWDHLERIRRTALRVGEKHAFFLNGDHVVALNLQTGEEQWRVSRLSSPVMKAQFGYNFHNLSDLVSYEDMVFLVESSPEKPWQMRGDQLGFPYGGQGAKIVAFSAGSGEKLWTRRCYSWGYGDPPDIFVIDGLVWAHDANDASYSMMGLDPKTGEVKDRFSTNEALRMTHHHRCYRDKATQRYILTARRGVEFLDTQTGDNMLHHWARGTCRLGIMPANGLLYVPPHPCACYITAQLSGFYSLAPEQNITKKLENGESKMNLLKGPAYDFDLEEEASLDSDWPTYRHDHSRSGHTPASLPAELKRKWETKLPTSPSGPTIADGKMFVSSVNSHTVYCVDTETGSKLWSYTTGGRVDTPPTYYKGLLLFGSDDGWVYCLDATEGTLAWRFQAAPLSRYIVDHGQLASAWGLHGSVLVYKDRAYVCAGRSSFLDGGIFVYVLNPKTGEVIQKEQIYSVQPETGEMARSELPYDMPPEHPGAKSDVLVTNGEHVYMRHLQFNPEDISDHQLAGGKATISEVLNSIEDRDDAHDFKYTGQHPGEGEQLFSNSGLLDDSWFNQSYWSVNGMAHSRMLCFSDKQICGLRAFDASRRHDRSTFAPREEDYTLFSMNRLNGKEQWSRKIPVRGRAMVLANDKLFIAGTPNVVPEEDPWAAFKGQKGGELWVFSASDGKQLARYKLGARPVYDGLIATEGQLYIALQDGKVLCLEER